MRVGVLAGLILLASSCAPVSAPTAAAEARVVPSSVPQVAVVAAASPTPAPSPTPTAAAYRSVRVFVTNDTGENLWVFEGGEKFSLVGQIAVGKMPHNLSVSPDGRWVATANRMANSVSIIDPYAMTEVARVGVGRQPHDLIWAPDGKMLFIGHERDTFIARIEAGTWRPLTPLVVGVPQHDLAISRLRPSELYYAVTNSPEHDDLRFYDLATNQITKFHFDDVHDVFFVPGDGEIWTTSSGYVDIPSDRLVASDPASHAMKTEFHLAGHYPFHTMKENRDGFFYPPEGTPMLLTDHIGPSLMWVDPKTRTVVDVTKVGPEPYHETYDPIGDRVLVTSNRDGNVWVISRTTHQVLQTLPAHGAHGIVAVGLP